MLTKKDLRTPLGKSGAKKLLSYIPNLGRHVYTASTIATGAATTTFMAVRNGDLLEAEMIVEKTAGASETLTVDILVNGSSKLSAAYVYGSTSSAKTVITLPIVAGTYVVVGDIITISRTLASPANLGSSSIIISVTQDGE